MGRENSREEVMPGPSDKQRDNSSPEITRSLRRGLGSTFPFLVFFFFFFFPFCRWLHLMRALSAKIGNLQPGCSQGVHPHQQWLRASLLCGALRLQVETSRKRQDAITFAPCTGDFLQKLLERDNRCFLPPNKVTGPSYQLYLQAK